MTVRDCRREYENLGSKIFGRPHHITQLNVGFVKRSKYDASNVENVFQDVSQRRSDLDEKNRKLTFESRPGVCKV